VIVGELRAGCLRSESRANAGHVWMNAVLLVVSHSHYATTDESGNFKIDGLPPGKYELVGLA